MKHLSIIFSILLSVNLFAQKITTQDGKVLYKARTLKLHFGEPHLNFGKEKKPKKIIPDPEKGQLKMSFRYNEIDTSIHIGKMFGNRVYHNGGVIPFKRIKTYYSKDNLKTKEDSYRIDGSVISSEVYEYDINDILISKRSLFYKNEDNYETKYIYNEEYDLVQELHYRDEELVSKYEIEYDYKKRMHTSYCTDLVEGITRKTVMFYNTDLKKVLEKHYNWSGNLKMIKKYEYNADGNKILESFKNLEMKVGGSEHFIYDGKLLIKKEKRDEKNKIKSSHEYKYDENGNKIQNVKKTSFIELEPKHYKKVMTRYNKGEPFYDMVIELWYY